MKGRPTGFIDDKDRQCVGKMKHDTKAAAKLHLRRAREMKHRGNLRPYRCPWCGYWHLGTKPGKKPPRAQD